MCGVVTNHVKIYMIRSCMDMFDCFYQVQFISNQSNIDTKHGALLINVHLGSEVIL